jgi:hypothetical protein
LIAAQQVDHYLTTGSIVELDRYGVTGESIERVETELQEIADRLDERGRRKDGAVLTLGDAVDQAGVRAALTEGEGGES